MLRVIWLVCALFLSGCAGNPERSLFGGDRVNAASANQLLDPTFETFDPPSLIRLICPDNCNKPKPPTTLEEALWSANNSDDDAEQRRSQIQDRLIAASDQRCNIYATYLKRLDSYQNAFLGSLTTILGGAGAIVTGVDAARALSGAAGITSGVRGELNQAFLASVATSVIVPAIRHRRVAIRKEIEDKRVQPISTYTIEGAIADAIRYHGACSIDEGLDEASKAVQQQDDIGLKRLQEVGVDVAQARDLLSAAARPARLASSAVAATAGYEREDKLIQDRKSDVTSQIALEKKKVQEARAKETDEDARTKLDETIDKLDKLANEMTDIDQPWKDRAEELKGRAKELDDAWLASTKEMLGAEGIAAAAARTNLDKQQDDAQKYINQLESLSTAVLNAIKAEETELGDIRRSH